MIFANKISFFCFFFFFFIDNLERNKVLEKVSAYFLKNTIHSKSGTKTKEITFNLEDGQRKYL